VYAACAPRNLKRVLDLTLEEMRIYYLGMESWSQMVYDRLTIGDS